jgi:hypothetical protein
VFHNLSKFYICQWGKTYMAQTPGAPFLFANLKPCSGAAGTYTGYTSVMLDVGVLHVIGCCYDDDIFILLRQSRWWQFG